MRRNQNKTRTVTDFIGRLAIHQHLNDSQAALVTLGAIWQSWLNISIEQSHLSQNCALNSSLANFTNGTLTINSPNAVTASELKHQKQSLLAHFNKELHKRNCSSNQTLDNDSNYNGKSPSQDSQPLKVDEIVIRIDLTTRSDTAETDQKPIIARHDEKRIRVSQNSLNALNSCINGIQNEELAQSLKSLSETISKAKT